MTAASTAATSSKFWTSAISKARDHIQTITGYSVRDETLLRHVIDTRQREETRGLAMLGDLALRIAVLDNWWATGRPVRAASTLCDAIANNDRLCYTGYEHRLENILARPPHSPPKTRGTTPDPDSKTAAVYMATTLEAVFGAVYPDSGKDMKVVSEGLTKLRLHKPLPPLKEKRGAKIKWMNAGRKVAKAREAGRDGMSEVFWVDAKVQSGKWVAGGREVVEDGEDRVLAEENRSSDKAPPVVEEEAATPTTEDGQRTMAADEDGSADTATAVVAEEASNHDSTTDDQAKQSP